MGRKAKYTKQQKVQACEDYLNRTKSAKQIVIELNMSKTGSDLIIKCKSKFHEHVSDKI